MPNAQSDKSLKQLKASHPIPAKVASCRNMSGKIFEKYRIIYLLKEVTIEILSVIHGARLLPEDPK